MRCRRSAVRLVAAIAAAARENSLRVSSPVSSREPVARLRDESLLFVVGPKSYDLMFAKIQKQAWPPFYSFVFSLFISSLLLLLFFC